MKKLVFVFLAINMSFSLLSQAPDYFHYQAMLRNQDGTPMANRDVSIQVELIRGQINGSSIYLESHSVLSDRYGMVTLKLGDGTFFNEIDWEGGPYFISITVDGIHMGTNQLLSVPYALYAKTAGGVEDGDSDSTNEIQFLAINETERELTISGGNTVELPVSPWKSIESDLYYPHHVGIGLVARPQFPLDIRKNIYGDHDMALIRLRNFDEGSSAYVGIALEAYGNLKEGTFNRSEILLTSDEYDRMPFFNGMTAIRATGNGFSVLTDSTAGSIRFYTTHVEDEIFERVRIDSIGDMGVGTTDPKAKIHVNDGDIFIEDMERGLILTSPDGQHWRITVGNDGILTTSPVTLK